MKVLILTCSTGEGHNSAANALHEYFNTHHVESEVVDTLSLINTTISKTTSDIYLFSTRTKMFKFLYDAGETVRNIKAKSAVYLANKLYCGKLLEYITRHHFDAVICVHLFPGEAITALKHAGKLQAVTIFVMTDYTCIPFMEETDLDYYIVPHEHLMEECAAKGIPRQKLMPYGIPVKPSFYNKQQKEYARITCKQLFGSDIDDNRCWMLIMSGSMGFGNIKVLVRKLLTEETPKEVFIICGNNKRLQRDLTKEFCSYRYLTITGFTDQIATLMDACDVLFTKPGGLSSTEAAVKNIPIIHTAPIPGCETHNALFFHYHGMSYSTGDVDEQVRCAIKIYTDKNYSRRMLFQQKLNMNPHTCQNILDLLTPKEVICHK